MHRYTGEQRLLQRNPQARCHCQQSSVLFRHTSLSLLINMAEERTPEQLEQDAFEDKVAGQTVAVEIVDKLVDTCGEKLYEHYLKSREVPYSSRKVIKDVLEVVNWMYRGKDVGEMGALSINADDSRVAYNENEAVHKNETSDSNTPERWTAEPETLPW